MTTIARRRLLSGGLVAAGGALVAGCDRLNGNATFQRVLASAEPLTMRAQRLVTDRAALAREFSAADLSPVFRANGTTMPGDPEYLATMARGFSDWRLRVDGLVDRPLSIPLADLRRMPARTQITRHDCVEGWSAIGRWTGAPLLPILKAAALRRQARYIVFHCADSIDGRPYYESIDLVDAFHPQTILAYALNGETLPVAHGAPVRLRVERQLGYKQAKYVMRIEAVERLDAVHAGRGGFWEDYAGYQWYAGI